MYFHNSGYRQEQYASLRSSSSRRSKPSSEKRVPSTSSDSGYASSAISTTTTTPISSSSSTSTSSSSSPVSSRGRRQQKTDVVYSCPRPLAFPFHNDCHFLPVAEADPRDIARISPPARRLSSLTTDSSQSDNQSIQSRNEPCVLRPTSVRRSTVSSHDGEEERLLGTGIKKGTVRTLRQLFNKPSGSTGPSKKAIPSSSSSSPAPSPPISAKFTGFSMTPIASRLGISRASNTKPSPFAVAFSIRRPASPETENRKGTRPQTTAKNDGALRSDSSSHHDTPAVAPARSSKMTMLPKTGTTQKLLAAFAFWDSSVQKTRKNQPPVIVNTRSEQTESVPLVQPWKSTSWRSFKSEAKEFKSNLILRIQPSTRQPHQKKPDSTFYTPIESKKKPGDEPVSQRKQEPTIVGRWWNHLKTVVVGNKTSRVGVM
ncbi:hypothetical protein EC973_004647 [Apophysomyces ossiformis]|uniref:Uncharacterized protein n=1 Tax=Apophysomyces ossiformis TaxID=679940 RepID=A0A8H7ELM8_9FUNG|nr:hypothetical protein EC973_004647 [Apophysomyces ossiformis]